MNKKQFFRLNNQNAIERCFGAIVQAVEQHKDSLDKVTVTIDTDSEKARSNAQNRLYWVYLHQIEQITGQDDEDWHLYFKRLFLSAIYARDDGEYAKLAQSIKECYGLISNKHYETMALGVIKRISTTTANTKQFAEYLNKIERWAYANNIPLATPQELEWAR